MAYNNISYLEAMKLLLGQENNRIYQEYTRYKKQEEWPALPVPKKKTPRLRKEEDNRNLKTKIRTIYSSPERRTTPEQSLKEYSNRKDRNNKEGII